MLFQMKSHYSLVFPYLHSNTLPGNPNLGSTFEWIVGYVSSSLDHELPRCSQNSCSQGVCDLHFILKHFRPPLPYGHVTLPKLYP